MCTLARECKENDRLFPRISALFSPLKIQNITHRKVDAIFKPMLVYLCYMIPLNPAHEITWRIVFMAARVRMVFNVDFAVVADYAEHRSHSCHGA